MEPKERESLEITTCIGCKNMCKYCPQNVLIKSYKSKETIMSFETFKKCIDNVPKKVVIGFSGFCEGWQNARCTDMLEYAHKKGHPITIFSSLVGMTLKDWERIKKIPFEEFWIHLPDKKGYTNIKVTEEYTQLLKKMKCDVVNKIVDTDKMRPIVLCADTPPIIKKILPRVYIKTKINIRAGILMNIRPKKGKIHCSLKPLLRHGILLPNGDVALCCMDYSLSHILGNLLEIEYEDLFRSNAYKHILTGFKDENIDIRCRKCTWIEYDKNKKGD